VTCGAAAPPWWDQRDWHRQQRDGNVGTTGAAPSQMGKTRIVFPALPQTRLRDTGGNMKPGRAYEG